MFTPTWGNDPILTSIFFRWVGEKPPTSIVLGGLGILVFVKVLGHMIYVWFGIVFRKNIDPNHQFCGFHVGFRGGVSTTGEDSKILLTSSSLGKSLGSSSLIPKDPGMS